jgi:hypothetical protein
MKISQLTDGHEVDSEDVFMIWKEGVLYQGQLNYIDEETGEIFNYIADQETVRVFDITSEFATDFNNMIESHYAEN